MSSESENPVRPGSGATTEEWLAYIKAGGRDLAGANLEGADLEGANLKGANLEGHDLDDLRKRIAGF